MMQQLTFVYRGLLQWREVPEPTLQGPHEALVRPLVVARCDLDTMILFRKPPIQSLAFGAALHLVDEAVTLLGKTPFQGPFAFGHEYVAEVISCGEEVRAVRPGQKVVVPFQISCGSCSFCQRSLTGSCSTVPALSMYGLGSVGGYWGGAISDRVKIPYADNMLLPVPEGVPLESLASAGDNLSDAWRTVGPYLQQRPEAAVLVLGGGAWSIGLYAVAIALALNSPHVMYVDTDVNRLAIAQSLGANVLEGRPPRSFGAYPITVDASASERGLSCALRSVEPGGICTSVGIYFRKGMPLPLFHMYATGVTFKTGRANARADIPHILSLMQQRRLHPERITTRVAQWQDAAEAFFDPSAKVIITRNTLESHA